jgi:radical SAM protein with 4Fe4S-binding SPASM domain
MNARTMEKIFRASVPANTRPAPGETRDCTDPWFQPFMQTNGDVQPCCWFYAPLGNINERPFNEIVNSVEFQELRRQLLTGDLPPNCITCPARGITTPKNLLHRLRAEKNA